MLGDFRDRVRHRRWAELAGLEEADEIPWRMIRRRHVIDRDDEELGSLRQA